MPVRDSHRRENDTGQPGIAVDASGGTVVDPTKNVLDTVRSESRYQNDMRDSLERLLNAKVDGVRELTKVVSDNVISYQNAQRDAETRRIDELAETRQEFQNTIRDMLAESVRTTSTLVSTQLVQIQATFDTRVSKLEAGAFTQAGKSSVADPQIADAMARIPISIAQLATATAETMAKMVATNNEAQEKATRQNAEALSELTKSLRTVERTEAGSTARGMGRGEIISYIMMGILVLSQVATILVVLPRMIH